MKFMAVWLLAVTLLCPWGSSVQLYQFLRLVLYQRHGLFLAGDLVGLWKVIPMASLKKLGYGTCFSIYLFYFYSPVIRVLLCIPININPHQKRRRKNYYAALSWLIRLASKYAIAWALRSLSHCSLTNFTWSSLSLM